MKTPQEICDAYSLRCIVVEKGNTDTPELRRYREQLTPPTRVGTGGVVTQGQVVMYDDPFDKAVKSFEFTATRRAVLDNATMLVWHELPAIHCQYYAGHFSYHIDALVSWDLANE